MANPPLLTDRDIEFASAHLAKGVQPAVVARWLGVDVADLPRRHCRKPVAVAGLKDDFPGKAVKLLPKLRSRAAQLVHDQDERDDLAQSTVTRALEKRHLFVSGSDPFPWLLVMMRRIAIDEAERRSRDALTHADALTGEFAVPPPQESSVALAEAHAIIDRLPPRRRHPFRLVRLDGLSSRDVGQALGIHVGAVKSRVARVTRMLAVAFDRRVDRVISRKPNQPAAPSR